MKPLPGDGDLRSHRHGIALLKGGGQLVRDARVVDEEDIQSRGITHETHTTPARKLRVTSLARHSCHLYGSQPADLAAAVRWPSPCGVHVTVRRPVACLRLG